MRKYRSRTTTLHRLHFALLALVWHKDAAFCAKQVQKCRKCKVQHVQSIMSEYRFHLQKYKVGNHYACPQCGRKRCFARYINEQGHITFPDNVGRCDHEQSCGYHYSPSDYFKDNPDANSNDDWRYKTPIKECRKRNLFQLSLIASWWSKHCMAILSILCTDTFQRSLAKRRQNGCLPCTRSELQRNGAVQLSFGR